MNKTYKKSDDYKSRFAINLKRARLNKKLKVEQLAICLEMTPNNYRKFERAEQYPRVDTILNISSILEVSLQELFGIGHEGVIDEEDALLLQRFKLLDLESKVQMNRFISFVFQKKISAQTIKHINQLISEFIKSH